VYSFTEPNFPLLIREITLIKDDERVSEQTFSVTITSSDPSGLNAATLQPVGPFQEGGADYRITTPGATTSSLTFPPQVQSVVRTIFINPDSLAEGTEAFQLTSSPNEGFPNFDSPLTTSTTAFATTIVQILDNDCKLVSFSLRSAVFCCGSSFLQLLQLGLWSLTTLSEKVKEARKFVCKYLTHLLIPVWDSLSL